MASKERWQDRVVAFHEELVDKRGDGWRAFWGSEASQKTRYRVLASYLPLDGATVLEVGCGFGDFVRCAAEWNIRPRRYLGIDLSPRMIEGARQRHPEAEFAVLNILESEPPFVPDYIIASGIMAVPFDGYEDYARAMLRRFHALCRRGFGINFLSDRTQAPDAESQYVDPAWALGLFQRECDWRCVLVHDYRPNDFTLIHRRD